MVWTISTYGQPTAQNLLDNMPNEMDEVLTSAFVVRLACLNCSCRTAKAFGIQQRKCNSCGNLLQLFCKKKNIWKKLRLPPDENIRKYKFCKFPKNKNGQCGNRNCSYPDDQDELDAWELFQRIYKKCWLKNNLLDPKLYLLKEEVCKELESFSWLSGAYGITGPNIKVHYPHLYITVKRGYSKADVRDGIKKMFGKEAVEYVELLREKKMLPKVKFMSVTPSGGISLQDASTSNPMQLEEQRDFLDQDLQSRAAGTLTLVGTAKNPSEETHHYGLTCYHICYNNDGISFSKAFQRSPVYAIGELKSHAEYADLMQDRLFHYHENENVDRYVLGCFSEGYIDSECDIMSIKINEGIELNCATVESSFPKRENVLKEFYERLIESPNPEDLVIVEKTGYTSGKTTGYLVAYGCHLVFDDQTLFSDVFVIKSGDGAGPFLEPADSGSLVSFRSKNKKYGFAYGVCEVEGLNLPFALKDGKQSSKIRGDVKVVFSNDDDGGDDEISDGSNWSSDESDDEGCVPSNEVFSDNVVENNEDENHGGDEISDGSSTSSNDQSDHTIFNESSVYICHDLRSALNKLRNFHQPCIKQCDP